jgi:hypothetical protein
MIRTYLKERQIIALRVGHVLKVRIVEIVLQILLPLLLLLPARIFRIILHLIRIRAAAWEEDKMRTQHLSILCRYSESSSQKGVCATQVSVYGSAGFSNPKLWFPIW